MRIIELYTHDGCNLNYFAQQRLIKGVQVGQNLSINIMYQTITTTRFERIRGSIDAKRKYTKQLYICLGCFRDNFGEFAAKVRYPWRAYMSDLKATRQEEVENNKIKKAQQWQMKSPEQKEKINRQNLLEKNKQQKQRRNMAIKERISDFCHCRYFSTFQLCLCVTTITVLVLGVIAIGIYFAAIS